MHAAPVDVLVQPVELRLELWPSGGELLRNGAEGSGREEQAEMAKAWDGHHGVVG